MKKIYLLILSGLFSAIQAQEFRPTWSLNGTETGTKKYVARESISLTDGFRYTGTQGNSFTATIDPQLLFPPGENTYMKEDGTITANPTEGAVVGGISGQFNVSPTGAATYSVPVECLPGINGMQPNISLVYNSQSGSGIAGMCWNLGGLSMISRAPKNYYYDDERSGIIWDKTSPLALDGQRLIKIQEWGTDSIEYATESGLDRIIGYKIASYGPTCFKVYTKEGRIWEYGSDFNTLYSGNNEPLNSNCPLEVKYNGSYISDVINLGWFLTKVTDANNNYIKYTYANTVFDYYMDMDGASIDYIGDNRLSKIEYGNNNAKVASVHFQYNTKSSLFSQYYIGGIKTQNSQILDKIEIKGLNDEIQKTYQLSYNIQDGNDFLSQIKQLDASGESLLPLKFDWSPMEYDLEYSDLTILAGDLIQSVNQIKNNFSQYSYGDIDGDGLMDMLVLTDLNPENNNLNPRYYWIVYRNLGNGSFKPVYQEVWHKGNSNDWAIKNENTFLFLDRNNDGKDELYVGRVIRGSGRNTNIISYWYCLECYQYNNNNSSFQKDSSGDMEREVVQSFYDNRREIFAISGDFLGTGTPQIIVFSKYNKPEFAMGITLSFPFGGDNGSKMMLTDMNGNGKTEIAYRIGNTITFYEYEEAYSGFRALFSTSLDSRNDAILTGDFNGDGNTDFLVRDYPSPYIYKIRTSTGKGLTQPISIPQITNEMWGKTDESICVTDVNQDGKSDIVLKYSTFSCSGDCATILKVLINAGNNNFIERSSLNRPLDDYWLTLSFSANIKSTHGAEIYMGYNIKKTSPKLFTLSKGIWFNKIRKVTDSFGQQLNISYKENKNPYSDSQGIPEGDDANKYIKNHFLPQLEIVDGITATNVNTSYAFTEPIIHKQARGFMGFQKTQVRDNLKLITQTSESKLDDTFHFMYPYKNTIATSAGTKMSETVNAYTVMDKGNKKYFLQQDLTTSTDALKGITVKTSYQNYDSDRNPQTITTDYGSGIVSAQSLTYVKKGSRFLNKISSSRITQKATGQPDAVRKEYFFYDNKGNITLQTADSTDVNKVQTFYSNYDQYGNPRKTTTVANDIARSQTFTYSPSGRFVHTQTDNQTGQAVTYNYDESKGLLLSQTDRIGATTYRYDNWGRVKETVCPDGIKSANILQWAGNISGKPSSAKYYNYTETSGQSPVWVWYDALGREIRRDAYGLNKKKTFVDTEYNGKGQLYRVSEPYFANATKTWAETHSYDKFGRVTTTATPMGTISNAYSGLKTTVTSPTGTQETTTNGAGWTVSQKTNGKTVNFTHYASGLVKTATPEGGQALTIEYDLQGNRTKLIDPDAGTIESKYDGWGQLSWEKQAVHRTYVQSNSFVTTNYYYLPSGLLDHKDSGSQWIETTNYEYDNLFRLKRISINPLNRLRPPILQSINSRSFNLSGRHSQAFVYDRYDRIIQINDTVEGMKTFVRKTEYDALGNIVRETYPGGLFITNSYDSYGYLTQVKDKNGILVWKAVESNARGQLTKTQGMAGETSYGFDDRGLPTSIVTGQITNQGYKFDAKGNLEYRQDNITGHKETFNYDSMNRLENGSISQNNKYAIRLLSYDPVTGNISSKSDLNGYAMNYGENGKPHALTSISGQPTAIPSGEQFISYTDFQKVETVAEGDNLLDISYGVGEQRIKTVLIKPAGSTTRYYIGNYEEEESGENIRRINYINGGNGLAALYIQNSSGSDAIYTVHTDYQGSVTALSNYSSVVERYAYDPWGNRRNPNDWTQPDTRTSFMFHRGYTMHEHLNDFNLINMNGRVYDPLTSMFLSPDPYVQAPGDWLNYNRYTYAMNNPLKYTDPSGEFLGFWVYLQEG